MSTSRAKVKAASQEERMKIWKEHFKPQQGNSPTVTHKPMTEIINRQLDMKLGQFTQEELNVILTKIKSRKTASLDGKNPEAWKTRKFHDFILRFCNAVYKENTIERLRKGCILPFLIEGDPVITKNYECVTLTAIAIKDYNALFLNRIEPEIEQFLGKIKTIFGEIDPDCIIHCVIGISAKNLESILLFVDFSKAFDSIHRWKMGQM